MSGGAWILEGSRHVVTFKGHMKMGRMGWLGAVGATLMAVGCAKPAAVKSEVAVAPPAATAPIAPASGPTAARVAKAAPTLFGDLFEPGRIFLYAVEQESAHYDPSDARANAAGYVESKETSQILCAVSDVHDVRFDRSTARAARLDCGDGNQIGMTGASVAGLYVLGAKGIYRYTLDTKDEDLTEIPEAQSLVLEREPVASRKVDDVDFPSAVEVKQDDGGAWCRSNESMGGDYFAASDCFVPGKGIVKARREFSGAATFVTTFTAI